MIILGLALAMGIEGLAAGVTVRLKPDNHPMLEINGAHFNPPVTIKADGSTIAGLRIVNSSGIIWLGGTIMAPTASEPSASRGYAAHAVNVEGLRFEGVSFTAAARGLVVTDSRNVTIRNSSFTGLRTDGIDAPGTSQLLIENNRFTDFRPILPTGSKADGNWKDGDHPDAIQFWTTATNPTMRDIIVRGNVIIGDTQGISTFGPRGQGYDRIAVTGNSLTLSRQAGIALFACRDCSITGNSVLATPDFPKKVNVRFDDSQGRFCGNSIPSIPRHPAAAKC
ncbi:MAG: hypothetical protein CFE37_04445 [Alphaproteobacteria bacterium PA4]|nr:MAG: hypothetical protein CFE37_04445 [Alphaproteobacteria bacterium PA4]